MKYRLLKDLPWVKAGTIRDEEDFMYDVEIHEEWFEPIYEAQPSTKKPKTVSDIESYEEYWYIENGMVKITQWWNTITENNRRLCWDTFLTKEDAERELAYRKAKSRILKHHAENSGFVPDWGDFDEYKFCIFYRHDENIFGVDYWHSVEHQGICFFATEEEAQQSIEDCEKEWKVIFNVK